MNQKIIVVDNFYDIAHMYHKSFSEHVKEINPQELPDKLSHILDRPIDILEGFNIVDNENTPNAITANTGFDVNNKEQWEEYTNLFVRYNRLVLFRADLWHSYGTGFGTEINKSMMYQKVLIRNI